MGPQDMFSEANDSPNQPPKTPSEGERPKKRAKSRTTYSCTNCRRSKTKCDRSQNVPCTSCKMRGIECFGQDAEATTPTAGPSSARFATTSPALQTMAYPQYNGNGRDDQILTLLHDIKNMLHAQAQHHTNGSPPPLAPPPVLVQESSGLPNYADPDSSILIWGQHKHELLNGDATSMLLTKAFSLLPAFPVVEGILSAYEEQGQIANSVTLPHFSRRWQHLKQILAISAEPLCSIQDAITLATCFAILARALMRLPKRHMAIMTLFQYLNKPTDVKSQSDLYGDVSDWILNKITETACRASKGVFHSLAIAVPSIELAELYLIRLQHNFETHCMSDQARQFSSMLTQVIMALGAHRNDPKNPDNEALSCLYWRAVHTSMYTALFSNEPMLLRPSGTNHARAEPNDGMTNDELYYSLSSRYSTIFIDWVQSNLPLVVQDAASDQRILQDIADWRLLCRMHGFWRDEHTLAPQLFTLDTQGTQFRARQILLFFQQYMHVAIGVFRRSMMTQHSMIRPAVEAAREVLSMFHTICQTWQKMPPETRSNFNLISTLDWLPMSSFDGAVVVVTANLLRPAQYPYEWARAILDQTRKDYLVVEPHGSSSSDKALQAIEQILLLLDPSLPPDENGEWMKELILGRPLSELFQHSADQAASTSASSAVLQSAERPMGERRAAGFPFLLDLSLAELMNLEAVIQNQS